MGNAGSPLNAVATLTSLATTSKYPTTGSGISFRCCYTIAFIAEDLKSVLWKRMKCSPVQLWHTWVEEPDCFGQIFRRSSFWSIKRNVLPLIAHQPSLPYESCSDLEQLLWPYGDGLSEKANGMTEAVHNPKVTKLWTLSVPPLAPHLRTLRGVLYR